MFFSIIVPIFNVESYLEDCLQSLTDQSFTDFEVIAINDGSTDNSLTFLRSLAKTDPRIKVYNQNNQGLSRTRNNGVHVAKGQYILFLDSDDKLSTDALSIMHQECTEHSLDMLMFSANCFSERSSNSPSSAYKKHPDLLNKIFSQEDFFILSNQLMSFFPSACLYTIKRTLATRISFYPDIYHEDNLYTTELFMLSDNKCLRAINDKLYQRRIRPGSITQSTSMKHAEGYQRVFNELIRLHPRNQTSKKTKHASYIKAYNTNLTRIFKGLLFSAYKANNGNIPLKLKLECLRMSMKLPQLWRKPSIVAPLIVPTFYYKIKDFVYPNGRIA